MVEAEKGQQTAVRGALHSPSGGRAEELLEAGDRTLHEKYCPFVYSCGLQPEVREDILGGKRKHLTSIKRKTGTA
jgi:hypothetical protein